MPAYVSLNGILAWLNVFMNAAALATRSRAVNAYEIVFPKTILLHAVRPWNAGKFSRTRHA